MNKGINQNDRGNYDGGNYIDYNDLSEDKRKALYAEFLSAYPEEKKLSRVFRFAPVGFAAVVMAFAIASLVVYFVSGLTVPFIILMSATALSLLVFIIFKARLDKVRFAHSARYSAWLLDVKHIVAELKEK